MIEILLFDRLIAFDGRAVEVFGHGGGGESARYHVGLIQTLLCAPGVSGQLSLNFSTKHGGIMGLRVPAEKKALVEKLIAAVEQAKAAFQAGGPRPEAFQAG